MRFYSIPHVSSTDAQLQAPTSEDIGNLTGAETFFSSDEYLIPQIEDDPLLRAYHYVSLILCTMLNHPKN